MQKYKEICQKLCNYMQKKMQIYMSIFYIYMYSPLC